MKLPTGPRRQLLPVIPMTPDVWFSTTRSELTKAMMLCRSCPRSQRCNLDALDLKETRVCGAAGT